MLEIAGSTDSPKYFEIILAALHHTQEEYWDVPAEKETTRAQMMKRRDAHPRTELRNCPNSYQPASFTDSRGRLWY